MVRKKKGRKRSRKDNKVQTSMNQNRPAKHKSDRFFQFRKIHTLNISRCGVGFIPLTPNPQSSCLNHKSNCLLPFLKYHSPSINPNLPNPSHPQSSDSQKHQSFKFPQTNPQTIKLKLNLQHRNCAPSKLQKIIFCNY